MGNAAAASRVHIDPLRVVVDKTILLETETREATWRLRAAPGGRTDFLAARDGSVVLSGTAVPVPRDAVVRLGHHPGHFDDVVWAFCPDETPRDFHGDRPDVVGTMSALLTAVIPGSGGVSYMFSQAPITLAALHVATST